jgi:hypothetical protein
MNRQKFAQGFKRPPIPFRVGDKVGLDMDNLQKEIRNLKDHPVMGEYLRSDIYGTIQSVGNDPKTWKVKWTGVMALFSDMSWPENFLHHVE